MPSYLAPGVFVEERNSGARPIAGVSTSTAAFIGVTERGPVGRAVLVTGFADFVKRFGGPILIAPGVQEHYLYYAVRHFFELGGTRCYVVRVTHYTNIDDPLASSASAAAAEFSAVEADFDGGSNAVRVRAISPGPWGRAIQVAVTSTSKFSLPLLQPIASGAFTSVILPPNTDVIPGTVLHIVHEITGIVSGVVPDTAAIDPRTVSFGERLQQAGGDSTATIPDNAKVFKSDFSLLTTTDLTTSVNLGTANPPAANAMGLQSVFGLAPGDALHFVVADAIAVVTSVEATTVGTAPAMRANVSLGTASGAIPVAGSRVYARDFQLQVQLGEVVESHTNLSIIDTHPRYVDKVLSGNTNESQYITATDITGTDSVDNIILNNSTPLTSSIAISLVGGNDGLTDLSVADFAGSDLAKNGLHALDAVDDASILVVGYSRITSTAETNPRVHQVNLTAVTIAWVNNRRDMFYIIDPPRTPTTDPVDDVVNFTANFNSSYAGIYFPWIKVDDLISGQSVNVPPAGAVAGVFARSDVRRGVHKAPAGIDVGLLSVAEGMAYQVTRGDNDIVYPRNINAIRSLTEGIVVWGSRTIAADPLWQQVNVRRLFIFLERSIQLGTAWVVFEPNDRSLWKTIERSVGGFLRVQWLEHKLVGNTEEEAFFVRCNEQTNPQEIVDAGMVVTEIGVAPSRPAEFVVFRIFQFAGRES